MKKILTMMFGISFILLSLTNVYSQSPSEYNCAIDFPMYTTQFIYVPASFNSLNSNLGQVQATATRVVVRNTDIEGTIGLIYVGLISPDGGTVINEYVTDPQSLTPLSSSVSFSTPNSLPGITGEDGGRHFFLVVLCVPPDGTFPFSDPIVEAERSVLNFNRAGNSSVQSTDITQGKVILKIPPLSP